MRMCKSLAVLLAFVLVTLTAAAGFAAAQNNPGVSKTPDGQIKPNLQLITVTLPKGGETWLIGEDHGARVVSWTYKGNTGDKYNIILQKGTAIVFKFPGDFSVDGSGKGSAWVEIPDSVPGGDDYRMVVTSKRNPAMKGASEAFSLMNLKITSPKGGEVWYKGDTNNITWNYSGNFGPKVYIWLMSDKLDVYKKIGEASISDKAYSWTITADIPRRKDYKILINNNGSYLLGGDWMSISHGFFVVAERVN